MSGSRISCNPIDQESIPIYNLKEPEDISGYDPRIHRFIAGILFHACGTTDMKGTRDLFAEAGMVEEGRDFLARDGRLYPIWVLWAQEYLREQFPEYFE